MTTALIYDLIIIGIALFFIFQGWYRGLVLSLASLVILICASIGAGIVSDYVTPLATPLITPTIESYLTDQFDQQVQDNPSASLENLLEDGNLSILTPYLDSDLLSASGKSISTFASDTISDLADLVAGGIVGTVIWLAAFLLISLALHVIIQAIDLVAKLPILNTLNILGGIAVGVVQGVLVIYIVMLVAGYFNLLPSPGQAAQTYVYHYFASHNPLSLLG